MSILFVDDDTFFGLSYVSELRAQFPNETVDVAATVDKAVTCVKQEKALRGIVLDIMMPKPKLYTEDLGVNLEDGLGTGIWFLRYVRDDIVEKGIRVLIITNRNLGEVEKGVAAIGFSAGTTMCFRKADLTAAILPAKLRGMLLGGRADQASGKER